MSFIKKNILFLPKWYPTKASPTLGLFIKKHEEAVKIQHHVTVFYAQSRLQKKWIQSEVSSSINGLEIILFYKKKITGIAVLDNFIKLLLYYISLFRGYKLISKKGIHPDAIHVHVVGRNALFGLFYSRLKSVPYYITEHWTGYFNPISGWRKRIYRIIFRKASHTTFVSVPLKNAVFSGLKLDLNYSIIPNTLDPLFLNSTITEPNREVHVITLVADLLDEHKNISCVLKSLALLKKERKDFELRVIGNGSDLHYFEHLKDSLHLQEHVTFLGELKKEEVVQQVLASSFCVLYSHYETFGVVLIEALALGKPLVLSNLEVFHEVVPDEFCIYAGVNNALELKNKLSHMMDSVKEYDPERMRNFVNTTYSTKTIGKKFNEMYD